MQNELKKLLFLSFLLAFNTGFAQNADNQGVTGKFYFYWGYNRAIFGTSDLHLKGANYNFTLQKIKASDRPSPFSAELYFSPTTISIPQYDYRIGYNFKKNWNLSLGVDHMKYVIDPDQSVLVTGTILSTASAKYAGAYRNQPVVIKDDFLLFEHTDGLNLVSLDLGYQRDMAHFDKTNITLSSHGSVGVGLMIPRTDSRVFGIGQNNRFHLAGYGLSATAGFEARWWKNIFFRAQMRTGWINMPNILLNNDAPDRAHQTIRFMEFYGVIGRYFGFGK
jgi:hypothetical protein